MSSTLFQAIKAGLEEIVVKFNAGLKAYKQATDDSIRKINDSLHAVNNRVETSIRKTDEQAIYLEQQHPDYYRLEPTGLAYRTDIGLMMGLSERKIMWRNYLRGDQTRPLNLTYYYNTVNEDEVVSLEQYTDGLMTNTAIDSGYATRLPSDIIVTEAEGKPVDDIKFIHGQHISFIYPETRQLVIKTPRNWDGPEVKLIVGKAPIRDVFSTLNVSVVPGSAVGYTYDTADEQLVSYRLRFEFDAFNGIDPAEIPVCFDPRKHIGATTFDVGVQLSNGGELHEFTDNTLDGASLKHSQAHKRSGTHDRYNDQVNSSFEVNIVTTLQNVDDGATVDITSLTWGELSHTFESPISVTLTRPETFLVEGQDF